MPVRGLPGAPREDVDVTGRSKPMTSRQTRRWPTFRLFPVDLDLQLVVLEERSAHLQRAAGSSSLEGGLRPDHGLSSLGSLVFYNKAQHPNVRVRNWYESPTSTPVHRIPQRFARIRRLFAK